MTDPIEYRALRANVLRLWLQRCQPLDPDLRDFIRFNEAIDQAIAESISFFNAQVDRSRNLLLGILGHDLRSPLQTIQMTAVQLQKLSSSPDVSEAATRLIRSGARMQALLDDLQDFNRTKLGLGLNIKTYLVDLASLCAEEIDQIRASRPGYPIELEVNGNCAGSWDGGRLQQVINNLVLNAIHYGASGETVRVQVRGEDDHVSIVVVNKGPPIERSALHHLFEPLRRGVEDSRKNSSGLGLSACSSSGK